MKIVLIVAISNKKQQDSTIDKIVRYFPEFKRDVQRIFNDEETN